MVACGIFEYWIDTGAPMYIISFWVNSVLVPQMKWKHMLSTILNVNISILKTVAVNLKETQNV